VSAPSHADGLHQPSLAELDPNKLEVAPGTAHETIQGWIPELASENDLRIALEKAFDYRGDVTVTRKDGSKIEGYIFDRVTGATLDSSFVRILPKQTHQRVKIAYAEIAGLAFTGRDTAAGKSWEAWVKKYWESKTVGEAQVGIEPEPLD
jgi:hypothetical protein